MSQNLPKRTEVYTIGEAAQTLGVAIDTLRRWEKLGKIKADRSAGGIRLFSQEEIDKLIPFTKKQAQYLSVSQAANYLDVSPGTLRRWDRQNRLKPFRTLSNERVYNPEQLDAFVKTVPQAVQSETSDPVGFLKEKAVELSDTVLISLIDKSALEHYRIKLLSFGLVVLIIVFAVALSLTRSQAGLADFSTENVSSVTPQIADQQKLSSTETLLPDDTGYITQDQPSDAIESISANGSTIVLHTTSGQDSAQQIITTFAKPTLPTAISFSQPQHSNTDSANFGNQLSTVPVTQTTGLNLGQSTGLQTGSANIAAGKSSTFVANAAITSQSKIFLSQTGGVITELTVSQKLPGEGFVVEAAKPATQSTSFDWLEINN